MKRSFGTLFASLVIGSLLGAMTGCYTVEGAGRDVAATGAGLAAGAEKTRHYTRDRPGQQR